MALMALSLAGFELATEDDGWERELVLWQAEAGAKEDFRRPAAGQGHAFFQVAAQKARTFWMKASGTQSLPARNLTLLSLTIFQLT